MFRWIYKQPEIQSFDIDAVTIKMSMTEYHHLINCQAYGLFYKHSSLWGKMSMVNLGTCLFSLI